MMIRKKEECSELVCRVLKRRKVNPAVLRWFVYQKKEMGTKSLPKIIRDSPGDPTQWGRIVCVISTG